MLFFPKYFNLEKYFPFSVLPWPRGASCMSTESRPADRSRPCHGAGGSLGGQSEGSEPVAGDCSHQSYCPLCTDSPPGEDRPHNPDLPSLVD